MNSRDIPGYYFDPIKKKYFKITKDYKPPSSEQSSHSSAATTQTPIENFNIFNLLRTNSILRNRNIINAKLKYATVKNTSINRISKITCMTMINDSTLAVGKSNGHLLFFTNNLERILYSLSFLSDINRIARIGQYICTNTSTHFYMHTASTFSATSRLSHNSTCHDFICNNTNGIFAKGKTVQQLSLVTLTVNNRDLHFISDVMKLYTQSHSHSLYVCCRNGTILQSDIRSPSTHSTLSLRHTYATDLNISDYSLYTKTFDQSLLLFDVRSTKNPVQTLLPKLTNSHFYCLSNLCVEDGWVLSGYGYDLMVIDRFESEKRERLDTSGLGNERHTFEFVERGGYDLFVGSGDYVCRLGRREREQ